MMHRNFPMRLTFHIKSRLPPTGIRVGKFPPGRTRLPILALIMLCLFSGHLTAGDDDVRVEASTLEAGALASQGFRLSKAGKVEVSMGAMIAPRIRGSYRYNRYYYGWIINSKTRKAVLTPNTIRRRLLAQGFVRHYQELSLPAGDYELYYTAVDNSYDSSGKKLDHKHGKRFREMFEKNKANLKISASGSADSFKPMDAEELRRAYLSESAVSMIKAGDNVNSQKSFQVLEETKVRIRMVGEAIRRQNAIHDYAWLTNAESGENVWFPESRQYSQAGGHFKNILIEQDVLLQPGVYTLHYVTDDSHASGSWNAPPPFDPHLWGVVMFVDGGNKEARKRIKIVDSVTKVNPLVSLVRVGNDALVFSGLQVKEKLTVRVISYGEGADRDLVDFGWITRRDGGVVWSMNDQDTQYAGGDRKNRLSKARLTLTPGHYMVTYRTDDSHAYNAWNASPPHDQENYGIRIYPALDKDRKKVAVYNVKKENARVLAGIIQPGNLSYREVLFELEKRATVIITAVGEGTRDAGMLDFGWIENDDNGKVVWEMQYDETKPAGGDDRNRVSRIILELPKGRYKVFFETNETHAANRWVSAPPENPNDYGIRIELKQPGTD